ncbi:PAS domain S-box protein [Algibacter sp. TI.3.09]|uniref:PAS domain-containing sensor histidine kinase n=1 Tax=Algibacter sp. TI.3.09 TaxID=3121298 RepID=UPI00311D89EA
MRTLKNKVKQRFGLFACISVIAFFIVFIVIKKHVLTQNNDAFLISKSGKQGMLSQRITKVMFAMDSDTRLVSPVELVDSLRVFTKEIETSHNILLNQYKQTKGTKRLDSLFDLVDTKLEVLVKCSDSVMSLKSFSLDKHTKAKIKEAELSFLFGMDAIVREYERKSKANFRRVETSFYIIFLVFGLILLGVFIFLWLTNIRQLIKKNESLILANERLAKSQFQIKENLEVVQKLKLDLEQKDKFNKIFIEQAAPSISMLDRDMKYIAVSEKWKQVYNMVDIDVVGMSHYDVFPNLTDSRKTQHQKCLEGDIDKCDEGYYVQDDGSVKWYFWDIRPWYLPTGSIGGLLMYSGDITDSKNISIAKDRIEKILRTTNKVVRIGTWELDIKSDKITFSDMSREILKLPNGFQVYGNKSLHLYKDGSSRNKIIKSIQHLKKTGEPFDVELEIVNMDGENIWIRDIGQAEFVNGECNKIFGIFQDITYLKKVQNDLLTQNQLLSFAENITMMGHWRYNLIEDIVSWSPNLYLMMEVEVDSMHVDKRTMLKVTHPEDREKVRRHMEKTFKDKEFPSRLIHRIITTNGVVKTIEVLAKIFTDDNNEITEIVGTCQDITHQRIAEIKFRGLLESAPDAMIIVNEDKKIHLVNKQAEKMFGYAAEELLEQEIEILLPNRFVDNFRMYEDNYFSDPESIGIGEQNELIGRHKNGEEFTVQVSLSPMQTEDGMLVSAAIRDITAQKEAEQKTINANANLKLLAEKLIDKNNQLADFAQITSHNLRAPVSNLNSLVQLYSAAGDSENKQEIFDKFKKVIEHLTITLNTLLEALRVKKEKVSKTKVYFDETLNKTKELLAGHIIESKAKITSDFSAVNSVSCNKIYFESIFLNLVENALKYKSNIEKPIIHIYTEILNDKILLKIQDNGLGIDLKKHRHKIFGLNKVFHRHPEARGVGLFMTKIHVESMGGEILVESAVGEGSTFIVKFNSDYKPDYVTQI